MKPFLITSGFVVCIAISTISGCTVGPDFREPAPPAAKTYTAGTQPGETIGTVGTSGSSGPGSSAQRFDTATPMPEQWWRLFQSTAIDQLVDTALANSPTLEQARARLVQAQENFNAQSGATRYPRIDAQVSALRQQVDLAAFGVPNVPNPGPFSVYSASVNVAYTFDLFGGQTRQLEGLAAQTDYQHYQFEAARLTLIANVVIGAIREAALRAQIRQWKSILAAQDQQLQIMEKRHQLGGISTLSLNSQRTLLAQTQATLPALQKQHEQTLHQLAIYLGKSPAEVEWPQPMPEFDRLHLPTELPLSLPADLTRQRPDIRAAEALWRQASANVGVATANLYPQITLSGSLGSERTQISDLADALNVWSLGANLLQPLFHGGELQARKRAAEAAYDESAALYRQNVLQGMLDVANTLRALEADAQILRARNEAAERAQENYRIAARQYQDGGISHLDLLDAERQNMQSASDEIAARSDRYVDTVALLQALGGSWQINSGQPGQSPGYLIK